MKEKVSRPVREIINERLKYQLEIAELKKEIKRLKEVASNLNWEYHNLLEIHEGIPNPLK